MSYQSLAILLVQSIQNTIADRQSNTRNTRMVRIEVRGGPQLNTQRRFKERVEGLGWGDFLAVRVESEDVGAGNLTVVDSGNSTLTRFQVLGSGVLDWVGLRSGVWQSCGQSIKYKLQNRMMDKYRKDIQRSGSKTRQPIEQVLAQSLRRVNPSPQLHCKSTQQRKSQSKKLSNGNPDEYETDNRKNLYYQYDLQLQQLRRLVSECDHCRARLPQFITKKPKYQLTKIKDTETQTNFDPLIFKVLQEKIEEIGRYNQQTVKELKKVQKQVQEKEDQLYEMEERLTGVFYKVSEDIFMFERMCCEYSHMRSLAMMSVEIPAFLKCLALDHGIQPDKSGGCSGRDIHDFT